MKHIKDLILPLLVDSDKYACRRHDVDKDWSPYSNNKHANDVCVCEKKNKGGAMVSTGWTIG